MSAAERPTAASIASGLGTFWAMPAGERKMPEPIVMPTTSATELQKPSVRGRLAGRAGFAHVAGIVASVRCRTFRIHPARRDRASPERIFAPAVHRRGDSPPGPLRHLVRARRHRCGRSAATTRGRRQPCAARRDAGPHQRPHPHDGRAEHHREDRLDPERPVRRGRRHAARPRRQHARSSTSRDAPSCPASSKATSTSSAWPTVPAITRFSRTRRRSARSRKRWPRGARTCRQGQWITSMGGWHPEPVGRASASDAAGARRGGARSAGAALRAVHRAVRDEQPRQGVLRRGRRRAAGASGHQAGERRGQRRDCRRRLRRRRAVGERAVPPAPAADLRRQEAQHARRDGATRPASG